MLDDREERNQRAPLPGQPVGLVAGPAIFGNPDLPSQLAVLPQSLLRDRARRHVARGIMFGRIPETRKLGDPVADRDDGVEVVVFQAPPDPAPALGSNC